MKEIWKTIVVDGKENKRYKVSSLGRIICLNWKRTGKPRICRLSVGGRGYLQVKIDGVNKKVHRIVAETFIANPHNKPCIDHINTIRTDNRVDNLRWVTHKENDSNPLTRKHKSDNNAHNKSWLGRLGADCPNSIPIVQLDLNGKFIKKWDAASEIQRELGIQHGNIIKCCKGKRNKAGGYRWMYYDDWRKLQKKTIKYIKPLF